MKDIQWYTRLFEDPVFVAKVKERFNVYYNYKQKLLDHIDTQASLIINKVVMDNQLWGRITDCEATNEQVQSAYQQRVDFLKTWLSNRFEWLKTNIDAL